MRALNFTNHTGETQRAVHGQRPADRAARALRETVGHESFDTGSARSGRSARRRARHVGVRTSAGWGMGEPEDGLVQDPWIRGLWDGPSPCPPTSFELGLKSRPAAAPTESRVGPGERGLGSDDVRCEMEILRSCIGIDCCSDLGGRRMSLALPTAAPLGSQFPGGIPTRDAEELQPEVFSGLCRVWRNRARGGPSAPTLHLLQAMSASIPSDIWARSIPGLEVDLREDTFVRRQIQKEGVGLLDLAAQLDVRHAPVSSFLWSASVASLILENHLFSDRSRPMAHLLTYMIMYRSGMHRFRGSYSEAPLLPRFSGEGLEAIYHDMVTQFAYEMRSCALA